MPAVNTAEFADTTSFNR